MLQLCRKVERNESEEDDERNPDNDVFLKDGRAFGATTFNLMILSIMPLSRLTVVRMSIIRMIFS